MLPLALAGPLAAGADESLFRALNLAGANPVLDAAMLLLTTAGLAYVLVLIAIPLWWRGHSGLAVDALVVLVVTVAITEGIKAATAIPRPCAVLPDVRVLSPTACALETSWAFPSGHTSRAFALAALLALRLSGRVGVSALVVAGLIGLSRIYLGLHWPSDVAAGAALGVVLAVSVETVARRSRRYEDARSRLVQAVESILRRTRRS